MVNTMLDEQRSLKNNRLLVALSVLTFFLMCMEISFLIQSNGMYLADYRLISDRLSIPSSIIPGVLFFIGIQFLLHIAFTALVWLITVLVGFALNFSAQKTLRVGVVLWFISLFAVLFTNRIWLPNSKLSSAFLGLLPVFTAKIIAYVLYFILVLSITLACFGLGRYLFRKIRKRSYLLPVAVSTMFLILLCLQLFSSFSKNKISDAGTVNKPNIIIIGVDSVRPDFLGFFGYAKNTPHIDGFLNHATVFSDSLTPLARTYPSWVSILTGVYPKLNTIRTNLADQSGLDLSETLPALLHKAGYRTVFATDESRFSNIDTRYGFDQVITPPIGFNDFLLGSVNDFPISNLLVNTKLGEYLFPHSYGNRAVFETYNPNSFLNLLQPALSEPRSSPLLFIVHFCLPHYPYAWESLPLKTVTRHHYLLSLQRADKQFHDFMMMLKNDGLLEHSVVVLLSDHGEAVEIPGDRITDPDLFVAGEKNKTGVIPHFYPPNSAKEKVNMSGGHGTDVLGLPQYHTMLAFRTFGTHKTNQTRVVPGVVSVMDIKPTILQFLDLPLGRVSGDSLQRYIFGDVKFVANKQDFFTESDFSPEAVRTIHPEERKVLFEGIDYFRIDPKTTHIVVRDSMLQMILSSKQFADYYDNWVLALYPQNNKMMMPVLVNLKTGYWTVDLTSSFAMNSPAHHMLVAMKIFFGKDITKVENT